MTQTTADPAHRFTPGTPDELSAFVRESAAARRALYPVGGGTGLDYGYPPPVPGVVVSTERFAGVIDYPARDMTVTVQAGMTMARLAELLHGERQQLPIDVPHAERATLGGMLATNVSGARRLGYGTLRDYVIGISAVDGQGRLFQAGGRVVKNVAGYDLCKLLVGSLGTLAVITQITFKLRPLPETTGLLWGTFDQADALEAALARLLTSDARPVMVEALDATAAGLVAGFSRGRDARAPGPWTLIVGVEGTAADVAWQLDRLRQELGPCRPHALEIIPDDAAAALRTALTHFQAADEPPLVFRANLLPSRTVAFLDAAARQGIAVQAHAGNGIVIGHLPPTIASAAQAETRLSLLRRLARQHHGNLVIPRCPAEWKADLPLFGEPEPAWPLMQRVKAALDPHGLLNPGRFLDAAADTIRV